jgi:hypothetical protein
MRLDRRLIFVAAIIVTTVLALAWTGDRLGIGKSSVAAAFDYPPQYPGYRWTRNGHMVPPDELTTAAGGIHCNDESATFLTIAWPDSATSRQRRQYVRDPRGVLGAEFRNRLSIGATLRKDAHSLGYRFDRIELFSSPSDQDEAIYVVGPDIVERWPRADARAGCH